MPNAFNGPLQQLLVYFSKLVLIFAKKLLVRY